MDNSHNVNLVRHIGAILAHSVNIKLAFMTLNCLWHDEPGKAPTGIKISFNYLAHNDAFVLTLAVDRSAAPTIVFLIDALNAAISAQLAGIDVSFTGDWDTPQTYSSTFEIHDHVELTLSEEVA